MKILVATGIYPPEVGGPSYYAKELVEALNRLGHEAKPVTYGTLMRFPTGLRHLLFFFRLIPNMFWAEKIIALDTFSVALPVAVASMIFRVPFVIRTGGDFVWEQYLERTGDLVPLKDFYTNKRAFTTKEKIVLSVTRFVLRRAHLIIFSTRMQKDIWTGAYNIDQTKTRIIENAIDAPLPSEEPTHKNFLWYVRPTAFKNGVRLHKAFLKAKEEYPEIILEEGQIPKKDLLEKMKSCHAVMLPSITEISPNYILDALRFKKPFIMDKYSGLTDKLGRYGTLVDPLSEEDIARAIKELARDEGYTRAKEKVQAFSEVRTYEDIAREFLALSPTIQS